MNNNDHKQLRRYNDQYHCSHCGRIWDIDDPKPPPCKTGEDWLKEIKERLNSKDKP